MNRKLYFGRRPKSEEFDDLPPESGQDQAEEIFDDVEDSEEEDEEVDFDRPSFKRDQQIWSDYAEDLDYDQ
ncbi:MAG TPA: hypothetical protein VLM37_11750 [Fibrobacteraceae bacterium]|nr:hypothetical protein [Fibrobacteraceae bacterium]